MTVTVRHLALGTVLAHTVHHSSFSPCRSISTSPCSAEGSGTHERSCYPSASGCYHPHQSAATDIPDRFLRTQELAADRDHKRIAILYLISITFFFFIGGALAGLIRLELLTPTSDLMASDTYNKVFTMHGIIMVFLFLVPLGAGDPRKLPDPDHDRRQDLALPKINLLSWYLYVVGGTAALYAVMTGGVDTGWTFTTPLSTHYLNTNVVTAGLGIFIAGFCSIFTGLNFIVTIHRCAPRA